MNYSKNFLMNRNLKGIGDIKWAHAVNNTKYLEQALNNADVHFIEVDISLSKGLSLLPLTIMMKAIWHLNNCLT
jgi:hypothetical protein